VRLLVAVDVGAVVRLAILAESLVMGAMTVGTVTNGFGVCWVECFCKS
jgi:hypothetical protein